MNFQKFKKKTNFNTKDASKLHFFQSLLYQNRMIIDLSKKNSIHQFSKVFLLEMYYICLLWLLF